MHTKPLAAWLCLTLFMLSLRAFAEPLPRDVQRFVDRREGCDHMRGEFPDHGEKQRVNEVTREINKLCAGTGTELAQLKRKYAGNSTIMQILNQFEIGIEGSGTPTPKRTVGVGQDRMVTEASRPRGK
jgi:hypothetical protein